MKTKFTKIASLLLALLLLAAMFPVQALALNDGGEGGSAGGEIAYVCLAGIHQYNGGVATKDATCEEPGETTFTCELCGASYVDKTAPAALGHDWNYTVGEDWEVTTPTTCIQFGVETRTCQRDGCGKTETRPLGGSLAAHDFTKEDASIGYLKSAANCGSAAVYFKSCVVCGLSSEGTEFEATFTSGEPDPDVHVTDDSEWLFDGEGHWHACVNACDVKLDFATHDTDGVDGACSVCGYKPAATGLRGDFDDSGAVDSDDALYLLAYAFDNTIDLHGQSGDVDNSGAADSDDALYLLAYAFDNTIVLYN